MITTRFFAKYFMVLTAAAFLSSCLKDDQPEISVDAADGIYIMGGATAFDHFDVKGVLQPALNAATGTAREGLYEIYIAVSSESAGFNLVEVVNREQTVYGPETMRILYLDGNSGLIKGNIRKGVIGTDAGVFRVQESGIYHVIIDKQTKSYVISPVSGLSVRSVRDEYNDSDLFLSLSEGFDKVNMIFMDENIGLGENEFRFRYGEGNKVEIDGNDVQVYTFFGGGLTEMETGYLLEMNPGGDPYKLTSGAGELFSVIVTWTVSEGFSARLVRDETEYPAGLYITGSGISFLSGEDAWNWEMNDFEMIPVHSSPHLFWKIVWLKEEGTIRFAPEKNGTGHFGVDGEAVNEIYEKGKGDLVVPGTAGYYMLVVNLHSGLVSVTRPQVYLIGDAAGSWNVLNPDYRFNIDDSNKVISLLKNLKPGSLRIYAWQDKGWFTQWWHAEFNIYDGKLVYRGRGPGLDPVGIISGFHTIELDFINGEASLELCGCS